MYNVLKTISFPKIDVIGIIDFMDILGKHLNYGLNKKDVSSLLNCKYSVKAVL